MAKKKKVLRTSKYYTGAQIDIRLNAQLQQVSVKREVIDLKANVPIAVGMSEKKDSAIVYKANDIVKMPKKSLFASLRRKRSIVPQQTCIRNVDILSIYNSSGSEDDNDRGPHPGPSEPVIKKPDTPHPGPSSSRKSTTSHPGPSSRYRRKIHPCLSRKRKTK